MLQINFEKPKPPVAKHCEDIPSGTLFTCGDGELRLKADNGWINLTHKVVVPHQREVFHDYRELNGVLTVTPKEQRT